METAVSHVWHVYSSTSALFAATILIPLVLTPSLNHCYAEKIQTYSTTYPPDDYSCSPGLNTPGVTVPKGDIVLLNGSSLEIFCVLNPKRTDVRNSSYLSFFNNDKEVPAEYLQIIDSTTLRLFIKSPEPSKSMYYCKLKADPENNLNDSSVCLNSVAIGFKPQEVQNFSCISMNWDNLTCTWDLPVNYVKTETKLIFYLPGRAGRRFLSTCPDNSDAYEHRCFWDRSTPVAYRLPYDYYYFEMTIKNHFGSIVQAIKFNHYAHVIPSQPANYSVISKTSNSIFIHWSVGFPMGTFPPGVMHKVEYKSYWDTNDTWTVVDTSHIDVKNQAPVLNLTGLKYAHTDYDIRIFIKSAQAIGNEMWSKPATIMVKTLPAVPRSPPKTDVGSFEISRGLPSREVYVYWQQIPEYMYNGDRFNYHVFMVDSNGEERLLLSNETRKAYALFKSFGLREYHLRVYSYNEVGYSKTGSDIHIPAVQNMIPEPLTFTKIAFENGVYELSWKRPRDYSKIEDYTIFWCNDNNKDRPYQCTGYLSWLHVDNETFIKNITLPKDKIYQFAISANSRSGSSGMIWAACTVIHDKVHGKMNNVWISKIGSTYIELGWKLDCSDRVGVIKGFRIYYCPLASPGAEACKGEGKKSNQTILDDPPLTGYANVSGLKPYTTYMLTIAILTKSGEGQQSNVLYNTTLEDAPEPPRSVRVNDLTNTSMIVSWDPPLNMNGVLRNYWIHYGANKPEPVESGSMSKELSNLQSYYTYNVSVTACTTACSQLSSPVTVRTLAGVPGKVSQPSIGVSFNKSQVLVSWGRPYDPRGMIEYYEVMITQLDENKNSSKTIQVYGTSSLVEMECEMDRVGQTLRYMVYVRAVNIRKEDNTTFYGPWSSPGERTCYNPGLPKPVKAIIIIFLILAGVGLIFGLIYSARCLWVICNDCTKIGSKLPPELDSPPIEKDDQECRMHGWSTDMKKLDSQMDVYTSPPDQESLLLKKLENECDADGDSSGCSSANESVSSSLTSRTHISDSGTEVDQQAESPEGAYMDASPPTLLRQRNVTSSRDGVRLLDPYVVIVGGVGAGSASESSASNASESDPAYNGFVNRGPGGYCRVGNAPQPAPKGYVSLNSTSSVSKPPTNAGGYVSHPPVWPPDHKGPLVTAPLPLPPPASKGYVMAGSLPATQAQNVANKPPLSAPYSRITTTTNYVTLPPSTSKDST